MKIDIKPFSNCGRFIAVSSGILFVSQSVTSAATVVIQDGNFHPADWSHEVRFSSGFSTVHTTVSQIAIGGVPDAYRNISYAMDHNGTMLYGTVYVLNTCVSQSYNPSTQGKINSIEYSEQQTRTGSNWSPALVGANPIIIQAGKIFIGPDFNFGPSDYSWTSYVDTNLKASDFIELNGMNMIPSSHPDFDLSGSLMQFGYARANSYSFDSSISHAIDNWNFTLDVTPIPEPSVPVLTVGLLGMALRRRREPTGKEK